MTFPPLPLLSARAPTKNPFCTSKLPGVVSSTFPVGPEPKDREPMLPAGGVRVIRPQVNTACLDANIPGSAHLKTRSGDFSVNEDKLTLRLHVNGRSRMVHGPACGSVDQRIA